MVIVMPTLAPGQQRNPPAIARLVSGCKAPPTVEMGCGIHEPGGRNSSESQFAYNLRWHRDNLDALTPPINILPQSMCNGENRLCIAFQANTRHGDGGDCESVLANLRQAGTDLEQLAADLQFKVAKSFDDSWQNVETKGEQSQHASQD